tara:strand:+ start:192 stop:1055 length:864 start_codon:yes stop_codon:yes gene_type:complete
MKTSPFKVTAGGVVQPELEPKPNKGNIGTAIADFVTPDSIGEALMNFIPFGGVGGKAIGKTKIFQQLMKKVPGLEKMFKSGGKVTKKQKFDFQKGLDDGLKAGGGVGTDVKDYTLPNYGKHSTANQKGMQDMLRDRGANLDEFVKGKGSTVYNKQNTKLLGSDGGRQVVEVSLPNGETQKFYKSTGLGKKVDSKDRWIPIDGTQTNARGGEWFNKGGSQATYKGEKYKGYENSAGEYVSVETQLKAKGVNVKEAMKSGSLKIDESGYDFDYGSTEFRNISKQLSTIY